MPLSLENPGALSSDSERTTSLNSLRGKVVWKGSRRSLLRLRGEEQESCRIVHCCGAQIDPRFRRVFDNRLDCRGEPNEPRAAR